MKMKKAAEVSSDENLRKLPVANGVRRHEAGCGYLGEKSVSCISPTLRTPVGTLSTCQVLPERYQQHRPVIYAVIDIAEKLTD